MQGTGFSVPGVTKPFHVLAVSGPRQSGKTHLACSAPGDIAIQSFDFGTNGVVQHFREEKVIWVAEYTYEVDLAADLLYHEAVGKDRATAEELKAAAEKVADRQADRVMQQVWKPFVNDRKAAFSNPQVRTVVDDTATEINEMLRLANFGKLERNPQLAYGPINAEYKSLVRMAHTYEKNLVLIHQVGNVWKKYTDPHGNTKEVETEELRALGNKKADYLVHSWVRMEFVPPKRATDGTVVKKGFFRATVEKARLNPQVNGMTLDNPDWVTLMMFLAPDVPAEAWL